MRTIEDILNDINALEAMTSGRNYTDEEAERHSALVKELTDAKRTAEIRAQNKAYNEPSGPMPRTGSAAPKPEDTLDKAFMAYLRTGQPNADIAGLAVTNAQQEGIGTTGGYLVPTTFLQKLVTRMKAFGGIANHVQTITTTDGRPIEWPTLDDTANEGEIVPESGTFTSGADLVFGTAALGAYKYMTGGKNALPLRVSVELAQDTAFDIEKLVSDALGQRLARIQARHLVTGTGIGQPLGLVTGRTPVEIAGTTVITYADLVTTIHSVDPAYRGLGNCKWAMNDTTMGLIEKIVDSHGDPLWRTDTSDMSTTYTSGKLLGYPVVIDQSFPDFVGNDNTKAAIAFGDFQEGYVRRMVKDVVVIANPWARAAYGEIEYTAWSRMDATQQNTNAYVVMSGNS